MSFLIASHFCFLVILNEGLNKFVIVLMLRRLRYTKLQFYELH